MHAVGDPGGSGGAWSNRRTFAALGSLILWLFALGSSAVAAPSHPPKLEISGFNHACGVAVDSKGDTYVANAGESKVRIFDPSHTELAIIEDSHEPCGLAVDTKGNVYVSEKATGEVVKYKPNAYPFAATPSYDAAEPIDSSGSAMGIAVDPHDDRLYVAEGTHIAVYKSDGSFEANIAEGELSNATGVAAYTYVSSVLKNFEGKVLEEKASRYIFVADDGASDQVKVFSGEIANPNSTSIANPKFRRTIAGPKAGEDFGFGTAGAYLAVDPGNRDAEDKCTSIAEQACTAGHFLIYDSAHHTLDEFDATGELLDQVVDPAFGDAEPTGLAVDRADGPSNGTIYVTADAGASAKLLGLGPLAPPSRASLPEPISHELPTARAVAVDSHGDVYVAAGALIHVYGPAGNEIKVGPEEKGIEDANTPLEDLAVDSAGNVYVLENEELVRYYTPSTYPPVNGTTYALHEPPTATAAEFPSGDKIVTAIAVNPANDHFFATAASHTHEYDSAADGSAMLNSEFAEGFNLGYRESIGVYGGNGSVYFGANPRLISVVNTTGEEVLTRISGAGSPKGLLPASPNIAVDQSNGHVLEFQNGKEVREYDASGAFVAEFGKSTGEAFYRIAIDSACAVHQPPLTEATTPTCEEFDPADGNLYVAFDDTAPGSFDLTAFGPLAYGEAPLAETGIASGLGAGNATLNGTVDARGFDLTKCEFEYLTDAQYLSNGKTFAGAEEKPCVPGVVEIGKGTNPVPVHADITGLDPEGRYRFRLVAENKYGPSENREPVLFGVPLITTKTALPVLNREATLRANIDPSGLATTYHFEYGKDAGEYDQSTPIEELFADAGPTDVAATLTGLSEGMTYHFRVVAENEAKAVEGPDQTFVTGQGTKPPLCSNTEYRVGLSAKLPDCRAYELVTPAETNGLSPQAPAITSTGAAAAGFNNWLAPPRGPKGGESVSYFTFGTLPGFDGNGLQDGYRAQRGEGEHPAEGWANQLFGFSYAQTGGGEPHQQSVASDQLYSLWQIGPPLSGTTEIFKGTLALGVYLRTPDGVANSKCNPEWPEPLQSVYEVLGCGSLGTDLKATSNFVSPGGAHIIFTSKEQLEDGAAPEGTEAIYDRAAGASSADVVSLMPSGAPFGAGENASFVGSTEDGTAIAFRVQGVLYLRREGQTTEIAAAPNAFAGISEDGKRVFYAKVADGSTAGNLHACDVEAGACAGPEQAQEPTKIAPESIFANVSPDGSRAFLTSEEALTGGEENEHGEAAEAGKHNLYAWDDEADTTSFVAALDSRDFESFGGSIVMQMGAWTGAINPGPTSGRARSPTRSTPAGEILVFQSHAQLTAYDNGGHGEIYRYDPAAETGGRLTCVSCDPSDAPAGADALLEDIEQGVDKRTLITNVTDDGAEVFFQSLDRLLPEDANSVADVYEWKAKGTGGCERAGGCLALISSGQGEAGSYLYGMSADGQDVFLTTREKLVGADVPGSPSIYDARVGGGIPEPPTPAPCQGDACQGNGNNPPARLTPAGTGSGEGNVPKAGSVRCSKGKHRVKGRCIAKHHKRKRHHKRRAGR